MHKEVCQSNTENISTECSAEFTCDIEQAAHLCPARKIFTCPRCDQVFACQSNVLRHMRGLSCHAGAMKLTPDCTQTEWHPPLSLPATEAYNPL